MAKITFLEADRPLVKSYSLNENKEVVKESYPHAWEFVSHTHEIKDLRALYEALRAHAERGHCLLKGELQRELRSESRAGSTDPNTPTFFGLLDVDRSAPGTKIEEIIRAVGLGDVDHIIQYSASHGIEPGRGATAHVLFWFSQAVAPAALKAWLTGLNFTTPALTAALGLTKSNNALSWPLDVSTCQNDKLIYIAPPVLGGGVQSTYTGERIVYVARSAKCVVPSALCVPTVEENRVRTQAKLDELRASAGLPKRRWTYKTDPATGLELLTKPDASTLTGFKQERGFTYFNLNGGDSWGYYHPDDAPEVIRNFKGEPCYPTKELLPEYWAQVQMDRAARKMQNREASARPELQGEKRQVLVFRDFRTSLYYNGTWEPATKTLRLARAASREQLQDYLKEHGLPEVDPVPVWNLIYDPQSDVRVDVGTRTINLFEPSPYMLQEFVPVATLDACPLIQRILDHAVGHDAQLREHFLNWVACVFRHRDRTMTAWVLHGVQGTGKGLFVHKVLVPLLGFDNVAVKRMEELEDQFNVYLETSLLRVIDEAEISESKKSRLLMANLKNQITEPQISIRRMHTAAYAAGNYGSFLVLSNQAGPVTIELTDRRFNVGEYGRHKLVFSNGEVDGIEGELVPFASYLHTRSANREQARSVLETETRRSMIATSTNSVDATAHALLEGDLEFFWDALPAGEMGVLGVEAQSLYDAYTKLIHEALRCHGPHRLTRDELRVLFAYNVGDMPKTPAKFTSLLRHHRVETEPVWVNGRTVRGVEISWKMEPTWKQERLAELLAKQPVLKRVA